MKNGSPDTPSQSRPLVWIVHPNPNEEIERCAQLARLGYRAVPGPWSSPEIIRQKGNPPKAVLVDFSHSPSYGRDIAIAMRSHRALITVPFLMLGASKETVAKVRAFLPDAIESDWSKVPKALTDARASPPSGGRQLSVFAAYANTPLYKKLGLKPHSRVVAVNPPKALASIIGPMPPGAVLLRRPVQQRDLTLWFVRSINELIAKTTSMRSFSASGGLWVLWQKASRVSGLNQITVRKVGLSAGMVDFKIARIDETWSGLRFTQRKHSRVKR